MHCPALVQVICSELLKTWGQKGFESHVAQVQNFYKDQRDKMLKAAETHLTGLGELPSFMTHYFISYDLYNIQRNGMNQKLGCLFG